MSDSFYGGPKGESFKISRIFQNKSLMEEDLDKGYASPYNIGSYVIISYGTQNRQVIRADSEDAVNINNLLEGDYVVIQDALNTNKDIVYIKKNGKLVRSFVVNHNEFQSYDNNKKIDKDKYGKTFNGSLWQKVFISQEDLNNTSFRYVSDLYQGQIEESEVFFQKSSDYGVGYKLISSIVGEIPIFSLEDTEILGPAENPDVEINVSSPDNPELKFSLPRAIKFFLTSFSETSYKKIVQEEEVNEEGTTTLVNKEIEVAYVIGDEKEILKSSVGESTEVDIGDYLFNGQSAWIFKVINITENHFIVRFCARFNIEAPKFNITMKEPYKPIGEAIVGNVYEAEFDNTVEVEADKTNPNGWTYNIAVPRYPDIEFKVEKVGPLATNEISKKYIYDDDRPNNKSRLSVLAKIARGSRIFTLRYSISQFFSQDGNVAELHIPKEYDESTLVPQQSIINVLKNAELGDVSIDQTGMIYEYHTDDENGYQVWEYYNTNLKGDSAAINFYGANNIVYEASVDTDISSIDLKVGNNTIYTTNVFENLYSYIIQILDSKYKEIGDGDASYPSLKVGDIFPFVCKKYSDTETDVLIYWACFTISGWSLELISYSSSTIVNEYNQLGSDNLSYSTNYINNLVQNTEITDNVLKKIRTYSAEMILSLIDTATDTIKETINNRIEPNGGFFIIDDVTKEKYKFSISNGKLYISFIE